MTSRRPIRLYRQSAPSYLAIEAAHPFDPATRKALPKPKAVVKRILISGTFPMKPQVILNTTACLTPTGYIGFQPAACDQHRRSHPHDIVV